jgi:pyruvate/2-oxoglutarate dehydrogenase complex dihydrolipoamide dehydrogenase (E3) component
MTTTLAPDICVIGAGSGGLSVAAAAAAFGAPVVLIERGKMGGDCLNYGCVPSKALLAAAKRAQAVREAQAFGVMADPEFTINFPRVMGHVKATIDAIAPNDSTQRFTAMGVTVIAAHARFTGPRTVAAGEYEIRPRRFVIATGSSPLVPAIPGLETVSYFTNETIFANRTRPGHLVIIGGGPIGLEMAQAHRRLGSEVTVLEAARALGKEDPELAAIVIGRLSGEGIDIREGAKVSHIEKHGRTGVRVHFETSTGPERVDGTHLLVAAGRKPNVEDLGLDAAGIAYDRKGITVTGKLRTSNRRAYAIGDVAGSLQFTHVANYHAGLVTRALLFRLPARANLSIVPWATYTDPELAQVGMDERTAREKLRSISIARWPYHENDRAQAERQTSGFVKVITDRKGRIKGAGIAGANAGELINVWSLAISKGMKLADVAGYVAPYPTLSEIGKRAAVSHYAPLARSPFVRALTSFLRKFG